MSKFMNAYERGKYDYARYSHDNPFNEGTLENDQWTKGYLEAEQADFDDVDDFAD